MRQVTDAHRSLARYIAEVLPDFDVWRVRTEPQEHRPYAVVKPVMVPQVAARSRQMIDVSQPFITYIYPEIAGTALGGQQRKFEVEEALYVAFFEVNPGRIPMYDYTGVPDDHPGPELPNVTARLLDGTPAGYDYMRVREYLIRDAQDAADERRWSITLTLRLAWRRRGQLISGTPVNKVTPAPKVH